MLVKWSFAKEIINKRGPYILVEWSGAISMTLLPLYIVCYVKSWPCAKVSSLQKSAG